MSGIVINYSSDILKGTLETLKASTLSGLVKPTMQVSIKPNMVLAKPPFEGATTHPEVVEGIIIFLKELDVQNIEIIESAWIGDDTKRVYKVCGFTELSQKYGITLHDLKDDAIRKVKTGEFTFEICEKALETDFLINVPVLKAHCQTRLTCCLKNLKGCISDREKRNFHTMGLHKPIAYLNKVIKTSFCVIDGICGDLTFEEGGNPVERNMLIAGEDPLLLDSFCASLLGYRAEEIGYIPIASEIGVGELFNSDTEITELNADKKPLITGTDKGLAKRLSAYIDEDGACSACYSALISAINRIGYRGAKISIGQGFKGKSGSLGCGNCTSAFKRLVKGCPPSAAAIADFLAKI
ncbi:MAG: DUF362 domain-containing protein [Oscillospiraceae bacterium]|nr:DUF362 domain-containing protein [Oscillospiraceae bacterium]